MITQSKSAILLACLAWTIQQPVVASEQGRSANASTSTTTTGAAMNDTQRAISIAISELSAHTHLDASTFKVLSTEAHTWPDSSLGCGKKGQMAAQVITQGYIITIKSGAATHVVHATDKYATICERNLPIRNLHAIEVPLRNLDDMIDKARADLADKLHTQPALIRTTNFMATEWPDTSMGCVTEGEAVEQKEIKGYRIALNYRGRTFVYHTDMERVRACPPVEAE
jgi:hypothetical protein